MIRYWVSWWSGNYADEGCTKPPFQPFVTGYRDRSEGERDDCSFCAVFDAESESSIWELIRKHYPDAEYRFIEEQSADWLPGDRFPGAEAYHVENEKPTASGSIAEVPNLQEQSVDADIDPVSSEIARKRAVEFDRECRLTTLSELKNESSGASITSNGEAGG